MYANTYLVMSFVLYRPRAVFLLIYTAVSQIFRSCTAPFLGVRKVYVLYCEGGAVHEFISYLISISFESFFFLWNVSANKFVKRKYVTK